MTQPEQLLYSRLDTYERRNYEYKKTHNRSCEFYEKEIDSILAEIQVIKLMKETGTAQNPWKVTTDCLSTVDGLFKDSFIKITTLDVRWSWRHFKFMYYVEYVRL